MTKLRIKIEDYIHEVRGKQVILDRDLAYLYECKNGTKSINLAVKRNIEKFPEDFMFQLTEEETNRCLRFHFETLNNSKNYRGQHIKYLPYAFTEEGVAMLASVMHTDIANQRSIQIMRAFVAMKKFISNNLLEQRFINNMVLNHNERIKLLEDSFNNKLFSNEIFYEGQIYDAYSLLLDILNSSKENIIVIDNYANKKLFDLLSKTNKEVTIYSKNVDEDLINKYQKQYHNVELKYNNSFHDRYIIIDKKVLYHCGASFKDLGIKCFSINKIDNINMINDILNRL